MFRLNVKYEVRYSKRKRIEPLKTPPESQARMQPWSANNGGEHLRGISSDAIFSLFKRRNLRTKKLLAEATTTESAILRLSLPQHTLSRNAHTNTFTHSYGRLCEATHTQSLHSLIGETTKMKQRTKMNDVNSPVPVIIISAQVPFF